MSYFSGQTEIRSGAQTSYPQQLCGKNGEPYLPRWANQTEANDQTLIRYRTGTAESHGRISYDTSTDERYRKPRWFGAGQ
ncbi:hypothetical protein ACM55O_22265, partial [Hafnia paralvei]|uniref:hypothetical protein n=1 Tax=Hafnia paralvei TaxID=546367 RepID=UPI0039FDC395